LYHETGLIFNEISNAKLGVSGGLRIKVSENPSGRKTAHCVFET
jgi:hypothetical protein